MNISFKWLQEYVDISMSPAELADRLTLSGLEVEAVEPLGPSLDGVVVGHVLDVQPHPNADRLTVCHVDTGADAPVEIICGAPNVGAGQHVPVATPGVHTCAQWQISQNQAGQNPWRALFGYDLRGR